MTSWSIKGRLIAGVSALTVLATVVGGAGWVSIAAINQTLNNITDISAPTVETSDDLAIGLWEATKVAEEVAASLDEDEIAVLIAEYETLIAEFEDAELELRSLLIDEATIAQLDSAGAAEEELVARSQTLFALRREWLSAEASIYQRLQAFDDAGAELNAILQDLVSANEAEMAAAEDEGDALELRDASAAQVNAILGELFERDYPMVRAALVLQRVVIELQDTAGEYLDEITPVALDTIGGEFESIYAAVTPQLDLLDRFAETDGEREVLLSLRAGFESLRMAALGDGMLFAAHRGTIDVARRADQALSELENGADAVAEILDVIATTADAVSDAADEEAASSVNRASALIIGTLVAALIAAVLLVLMVVRTVTGPIKSMTSTMESLAVGDTGVTVLGADRRDELGAMAKAVQVFKDNAIEKTRLEEERTAVEEESEAEKRRAMQQLADRFDQTVGAIVSTVTQQAVDLQETATKLAGAVEKTEGQSGAASAAAGQASGNVQTMAAATEELSSAINEVTGQLRNAATQLQSTATGARAAQTRMDELQAAIAEIDQVVTAINDVAEQTNLLALNATIEAARAGEAGKGFAVVAAEVKGLASNTRQMTDSISQQLSAVKSASESAITVSRSIVQDVDAVNKAAAAIASSMEQQSAATAEIGRNAQMAAVGTEEVTNNMEGVRIAATDTSRSSGEVHRAADDLSRHASGLQTAVEGFLKDVRAA